MGTVSRQEHGKANSNRCPKTGSPGTKDVVHASPISLYMAISFLSYFFFLFRFSSLSLSPLSPARSDCSLTPMTHARGHAKRPIQAGEAWQRFCWNEYAIRVCEAVNGHPTRPTPLAAVFLSL